MKENERHIVFTIKRLLDYSLNSVVCTSTLSSGSGSVIDRFPVKSATVKSAPKKKKKKETNQDK